MSFIEKLDRARAILERQGRLSVRALGRELAVDADELEELIEELVDAQLLARREGKVLVWAGAPAAAKTASDPALPLPRAPEPATARKVVTIVFADLIGSTALHEQLDAESVTRLMESVGATNRRTRQPPLSVSPPSRPGWSGIAPTSPGSRRASHTRRAERASRKSTRPNSTYRVATADTSGAAAT